MPEAVEDVVGYEVDGLRWIPEVARGGRGALPQVPEHVEDCPEVGRHGPVGRPRKPPQFREVAPGQVVGLLLQILGRLRPVRERHLELVDELDDHVRRHRDEQQVLGTRPGRVRLPLRVRGARRSPRTRLGGGRRCRPEQPLQVGIRDGLRRVGIALVARDLHVGNEGARVHAEDAAARVRQVDTGLVADGLERDGVVRVDAGRACRGAPRGVVCCAVLRLTRVGLGRDTPSLVGLFTRGPCGAVAAHVRRAHGSA